MSDSSVRVRPAELVPRTGEAVVAFWRDAAPIIVRLGPTQTLTVGRREDGQLPRSQDGDLIRVTLPCRERFLSSHQLTVGYSAGRWEVRIRGGVLNAGSTRRWGDQVWRSADPGEVVLPYQGLLSVLLPGSGGTRMTVSALAPVPGRTGSSSTAVTVKEPLTRLTLPPGELDLVVATFLESLRWPPQPGPSRPRGWTEQSRTTSDATRAAWERLAGRVSNQPDFDWYRDPALRGADPTVLAGLIDSGSVDYGSVYRRAPGELIPTQFTHRPDGAPWSAHG